MSLQYLDQFIQSSYKSSIKVPPKPSKTLGNIIFVIIILIFPALKFLKHEVRTFISQLRTLPSSPPSRNRSPSSPLRSKSKQLTNLLRLISQTTIMGGAGGGGGLRIFGKIEGKLIITEHLLNVEHSIALILPHKADYVKLSRILDPMEAGIDPFFFLVNSKSILSYLEVRIYCCHILVLHVLSMTQDCKYRSDHN